MWLSWSSAPGQGAVSSQAPGMMWKGLVFLWDPVGEAALMFQISDFIWVGNVWLLPWVQHLPMGCSNFISPTVGLSGHEQEISPGGRMGCEKIKNTALPGL